MTPEERKSWEFAISSFSEHVSIITNMFKLNQISAELQDKEFIKLQHRFRQIKVHAEIIRDHLEILDVIHKRNVEREESGKTKRLQTNENGSGGKLE